MIHQSEISALMEQGKCTCWFIKDTQGNDLFKCKEGISVENSINELEKMLDAFKHYKRVVVWAGTKNNGDANWKGAYRWTVSLEDKKDMNATSAGLGMLAGKDYVPREVMETKLALIQKENELNNKLSAMERKIEENRGWLSGLAEKLAPQLLDKFFPSVPAGVSLSGPAGAIKDVRPEDKIKFDRVEHLIDNIFQRGELDILVEALEAIDAKPELLKTAASLIK